MSHIRLLTLGDSITEGVGDRDTARPNGVRGWADRAAEVLTTVEPSTRYANLAIRGRLINRTIAEQIPAALKLEPTVVTLYAGANDILRPNVNLEVVMGNYRDLIKLLRQADISVYLFTGFDPASSPLHAWMRARVGLYNELVRDIAADLDCGIIDYWRLKKMQDQRYWDTDRVHMNTQGHSLLAREILSTLFADVVPETVLDEMLPVPNFKEMKEVDRRSEIISNLQWTKDYALPWVKRRLTGVSSGDGLKPKYPDWESFRTLLGGLADA